MENISYNTEKNLPGGWGAGAGVSGATVVPGLLFPQDTAHSAHITTTYHKLIKIVNNSNENLNQYLFYYAMQCYNIITNIILTVSYVIIYINACVNSSNCNK